MRLMQKWTERDILSSWLGGKLKSPPPLTLGSSQGPLRCQGENKSSIGSRNKAQAAHCDHKHTYTHQGPWWVAGVTSLDSGCSFSEYWASSSAFSRRRLSRGASGNPEVKHFPADSRHTGYLSGCEGYRSPGVQSGRATGRMGSAPCLRGIYAALPGPSALAKPPHNTRSSKGPPKRACFPKDKGRPLLGKEMAGHCLLRVLRKEGARD